MDDKISLLIVEDHHVTRKGLESELAAEEDIVVLGAAAGQTDGLRLAESLKPDVILLDLHLPDSPGPKTLAQNFCKLKDSRIIVFSGDSRSAIMQLVLDSGVAGYLLKSEPVPVLAKAIRQVKQGKTPVLSEELKKNHQQSKLTAAEKHLLSLLARGMKYQDIAAQRVTAPETVRKQVDALLLKLLIDTREELIAWAVENGYGKIEIE